MGYKEDLLELPPEARARQKAAWWVTAIVQGYDRGRYRYTAGDLSIEAWRANVNQRGNVEVDVEASRNGVPLTLSNPFEFVNPPVTITHPDDSTSDDAAGAFEACLADAIRTVT